MTLSSSRLTQSGAGPTDAALVVAARAGERWAQEALFRRHIGMALGLAHRLLPQDGEVDDIVQDSFAYAFEKLASLQNPQAFAAWLGSIVVRTMGKRLRRRRLLWRLGIRSRDPVDVDAVISKAAPPEVVYELGAVYRAIESWPTAERIAFVLRRVEGLSIEQIAEHMAVSVSTVKRKLHAAEVRLERSVR